MKDEKETKGIEWWLMVIAILLMTLGAPLLLFAIGDMPWFTLVGLFVAAEFLGVILLWMAKITTILGEISDKLSR